MVEDVSGICTILCLESIVGCARRQFKQIVEGRMYCFCCIAFGFGNIYAYGVVCPNQNLIQVTCIATCCPLISDDCAECGLFFVGQYAGGDVAKIGYIGLRGSGFSRSRLSRIGGFSGNGGIGGIGGNVGFVCGVVGCQHLRTQHIEVLECGSVQSGGREDLTVDDFVQISMNGQEVAVALIQTDPIAVLVLSVDLGSQPCTEHITNFQRREVFVEACAGFEKCTAIDVCQLDLMVENVSGICTVLGLESVEGGIGGQLEQIVKDGMYCLCRIAFCLGNIHIDGIVCPRKDIIHIASTAACLPLLGSNCAEFVFFLFGQHAGGDVAGLTKLFGTEGVPEVEADSVQFSSGHNHTGRCGVTMNDQEAVALIQSGIIVALGRSSLVPATNHVTDLQITDNICDLAVCSTLDTATPGIFNPDCLVIFCSIGGVGRSGAVGIYAGVKDETDKAVDSFGFKCADSDVDTCHLIEPRQNLIRIGTADGGGVIIGGLNLGQKVLFDIAQNAVGNIAGAAEDVVDVLEGSGGTDNDVVFEYLLLCGGVVKGVLSI